MYKSKFGIQLNLCNFLTAGKNQRGGALCQCIPSKVCLKKLTYDSCDTLSLFKENTYFCFIKYISNITTSFKWPKTVKKFFLNLDLFQKKKPFCGSPVIMQLSHSFPLSVGEGLGIYLAVLLGHSRRRNDLNFLWRSCSTYIQKS